MNDPKLSRKEFLKITWLAILSVFLKACGIIGIDIPENPPQSSIADIDITSTDTNDREPTSTAESTTTTTQKLSHSSSQENTNSPGTVALVNTDNRAKGVTLALELLNINPFSGKSVFLKPNFNSSDPAPGSTHPVILRELILQIQKMGATNIILGDRSGMGNTGRVMEKLGIFDLAEELGIEPIILDDLLAEDWEIFSPSSTNWSQGIPFARPALNADVIVQACCLKTHRYGGHFTMSLKNSVGLVAKTVPGIAHNFMNELHSSPNQRKMIAEINQIYQPGLIVMDGVQSFVTGGPASGKIAESQIILASTDRIAIDAVGVAVLRKFGTTKEVSKGKIFDQEQIARAVELGLGIDSPDKITFLTNSESSEKYAEELREFLSV